MFLLVGGAIQGFGLTVQSEDRLDDYADHTVLFGSQVAFKQIRCDFTTHALHTDSCKPYSQMKYVQQSGIDVPPN